MGTSCSVPLGFTLLYKQSKEFSHSPSAQPFGLRSKIWPNEVNLFWSAKWYTTFTIKARPAMSAVFKNVFRHREIGHILHTSFENWFKEIMSLDADVHTTGFSIASYKPLWSFFYWLKPAVIHGKKVWHSVDLFDYLNPCSWSRGFKKVGMKCTLSTSSCIEISSQLTLQSELLVPLLLWIQ